MLSGQGSLVASGIAAILLQPFGMNLVHMRERLLWAMLTDLVAYWDFNSGAGYTIKDVTNHGHDLIAVQAPKWEVVRWLSSCGNGVVEGNEECDDGDIKDGDGCSSTCRMEPGWSCVGNPSKCIQDGGSSRPPPPGPAPAPAPGASRTDSTEGSGGGGKHSGGTIATAVLVPMFLVVLVGALFAYRGALYEQFPQVRSGVPHVIPS